jgi:protein-tyrosine-phosphatase
LKPFITSFARCKTARTINDNNLIDNVVRIHTDGIVLDKEFDFIITVCDNANNEPCPLFLGKAAKLHFGMPDPAAFVGSEEETLNRVMEVARG